MQHQEFAPAEELQDTIKCFWYNRRESGAVPSAFEVQPDGYAEIIFYFGDLYSMDQDGGLQTLPSPFIMGLLNQPAVFYSKNVLDILAVRCFPWTVFDLLGLPSGKEGLHIIEHPIAQLQSELAKCVSAGNIGEALARLKTYFLNARSHITADSMLFKAGVAMRGANGAIPVSEVAAAAHATARTLERKFKQSSGHTIKDVSGLMRFEQVRNHLWHNPGVSLTALSHELGYADQSHLSREFKRYSGTTPGAFARKSKKGKPPVGHDFVAFVQS
jgi:AraC-like DNA-binding protein